MTKSFMSRRLFGVSLDHLISGTFLFSLAFTILLASMLLVPVLQFKLSDQEKAVFPKAAEAMIHLSLLRQERAALLEAWDRVRPPAASATAAAQQSRPMVQLSGLGGMSTDYAMPPDIAAPQGPVTCEPLNPVVTVDSLQTRILCNTEALLEAKKVHLALMAQHPEAHALLTKLEMLPQLVWAPAMTGPEATAGNFLVLALILMMGALGGTISVAKSFVTTGELNPRPVDYFIRPVFGMVTAFVIFLLFKSGGAMLSTDTKFEELNPFPIALLGVVSGLMAKEALGRIEEWGRRFLGGDAAVTRVRGLSDGDHQRLTQEKTAELNRLESWAGALADAGAMMTAAQAAALAGLVGQANTAIAEARQVALTVDQALADGQAETRRAATASSEGMRDASLQNAERLRSAAEEELDHLRAKVTAAEDAVQQVLAQIAED